MKITSSNYTAITSVTPKIVETGNGLLINTQYYTKEKLSAVALEFLKLTGSPYALSTRKQLYLAQQTVNWRFQHDETGILKDNVYNNRYYIRVIGGYIDSSAVSNNLVTIEESPNGEFKCLNITSITDTFITDFHDQDDNFIYISTKSNGATTFYTLNKTTFALVKRWELTGQTRANVRLTKIYRDDTYIYFMYYHDQSIYTMIYNKSTHTHTTSTAIYRGQETTTVNNILTVFSDDMYELDKDTSGLFLFNSADAVQPIDLYCYDRTKNFENGFTMKPVTIIWNDNKSQIDFSANNISNTIRTFISEFDDVKYLNIVSYSSNFVSAAYTSFQGIYTFRIDSDTQLTFTGFNQMDNTRLISGFIYDQSKEHLIIAKLNTFQVLKFNKTTKAYENTSSEIPGCYSVGLDELQRIWYIKTDTSTHMINLEDAQSVDVKFEKNYYDFTGSAIDTYITFSAVNYLGDLFAGTFELSLSGPAVFADNGETSITINYIGEGTQQIGLTILGASPVTIYPKFIKTS